MIQHERGPHSSRSVRPVLYKLASSGMRRLALWVGLPGLPSPEHTPGPPHGGRWRAAPSPQRRPGRLDQRGSIGWSFLFPQMAAAPKAFQKILALVTGTRTGCSLEEPSLFLKDGQFLKGSNAHLELPAAGSVTETSGPAMGPPGSCPPGCPSWRRKSPGDFVPSTETVFLAVKNLTPRHPGENVFSENKVDLRNLV